MPCVDASQNVKEINGYLHNDKHNFKQRLNNMEQIRKIRHKAAQTAITHMHIVCTACSTVYYPGGIDSSDLFHLSNLNIATTVNKQHFATFAFSD